MTIAMISRLSGVRFATNALSQSAHGDQTFRRALTLLVLLAGCTPTASQPMVVDMGTESEGTLAAPRKIVKYCTSTVYKWDVHHCISEVTREQQQRRALTYVLTYEDDRLVRFERTRGDGWPVALDGRCFAWLFHYLGDTHTSARCVDRFGIVRRRNQISEDRAYYQRGDAAGNPLRAGPGRISGLLREFDDEGHVTSYRYVDEHRRPTTNSVGVHEIHLTNNPRGAAIERRYFDMHRRPTVDDDNVHIVRFEVDDRGHHKAVRLYDLHGAPVLSRVDGNHGYSNTLDEVGNIIGRRYFGLKHEPVVLTSTVIAGIDHTYDEHGRNLRDTYVGLDGRPAENHAGYATRMYRYDALGRRVETAYFGANGEPKESSRGYATKRIRYDTQHRVVEERLFNTDGSPRSIAFAIKRWSYDSRGNPAVIGFFSATDEPETLFGYHRRVMRHDAHDLRLETRYEDSQGKLVESTLGYARLVSVRNRDGSISRNQYFDAQDQPVTVVSAAIVQIMASDAADMKVAEAKAREALAALKRGAHWEDVWIAYDSRAATRQSRRQGLSKSLRLDRVSHHVAAVLRALAPGETSDVVANGHQGFLIVHRTDDADTRHPPAPDE